MSAFPPKIKQLPIVRRLLRGLYDYHFSTASGWQRMFNGVYGSFEEAIASAPKTKGIGYNNPQSAMMYVNGYRIVNSSDYPILFWLKSLLPGSDCVFDLGGNVGISYYSYQKYLAYPEGLTWLVYDVPEVLRKGIDIAAKEQAKGLSFSGSLSDANGVDILLANGSIQFVERPLSELLRELREKPTHLLINKTPVREGSQFVTLQALGTAYCPYYIFNRKQFVDSITAAGYELVDSWLNDDLSCHIPLQAQHSVNAYSGFYFRKMDLPLPTISSNGVARQVTKTRDSADD
jgi:putative methyltransferase (TIGR04325 family)